VRLTVCLFAFNRCYFDLVSANGTLLAGVSVVGAVCIVFLGNVVVSCGDLFVLTVGLATAVFTYVLAFPTVLCAGSLLVLVARALGINDEAVLNCFGIAVNYVIAVLAVCLCSLAVKAGCGNVDGLKLVSILRIILIAKLTVALFYTIRNYSISVNVTELFNLRIECSSSNCSIGIAGKGFAAGVAYEMLYPTILGAGGCLCENTGECMLTVSGKLLLYAALGATEEEVTGCLILIVTVRLNGLFGNELIIVFVVIFIVYTYVNNFSAMIAGVAAAGLTGLAGDVIKLFNLTAYGTGLCARSFIVVPVIAPIRIGCAPVIFVVSVFTCAVHTVICVSVSFQIVLNKYFATILALVSAATLFGTGRRYFTKIESVVVWTFALCGNAENEGTHAHYNCEHERKNLFDLVFHGFSSQISFSKLKKVGKIYPKMAHL
jgi:hypothetical protein